MGYYRYDYGYGYGYGYGGARRAAYSSYSIFDGLTLSPLPYPVLLILVVICIFLSISCYSSYEDAVETAEDSINWLLLAIPISIVFVVRCLSSMEDSHWRQVNYCAPPPPQQGSVSPWGVAALIIILASSIYATSC